MELECVKKKNFVIHDIEKRNVCCMKCVMCIIEKRMSNPACLFYHDENILKDYLKKITYSLGFPLQMSESIPGLPVHLSERYFGGF